MALNNENNTYNLVKMGANLIGLYLLYVQINSLYVEVGISTDFKYLSRYVNKIFS